MRKRDRSGYYAVLNVHPEASQQEIRLAYGFLKQAFKDGRKGLPIAKIQAAYETLRDRGRREAYDVGGDPSLAGEPKKSRLHSVPLLVTLLVIFAGIVAFAVGPVIKAHFTTFGPGDELYWTRTGKPLGTVVSYDKDHEFEGAAVGPAYQIETGPGQDPVWLPARDLDRNCGAR